MSRLINSWALGTSGTVSSLTLLRLWSLITITFGFSLNLLLSFLSYLLAVPAPRCARLSPQSVSKHRSYTALAPLLCPGSATALSHALVCHPSGNSDSVFCVAGCPCSCCAWLTKPGSTAAAVVSSGRDMSTAFQAELAAMATEHLAGNYSHKAVTARSVGTVAGGRDHQALMLGITPSCPIAAPAPWGLCLKVLTVNLTQPRNPGTVLQGSGRGGG